MIEIGLETTRRQLSLGEGNSGSSRLASTMVRKRGRPPHYEGLTPAEWRVVNAVRHGLSDGAIANRHGISRDAVHFHVRNALGKLGLGTRNELRHWTGAPADSALSRKERSMTMQLQLGPIGQISRSVRDIAEAERWYRDTLGLPHLYTFGKLAFFDCGGTRLYLSQENAAPGPESILYLKVKDIGNACKQLEERGVEFTNAPHMIFRHADGTEEWMAFFKDPEGRPLALMEQVSSRE
jgi:DNA-binding CsgD family transcriptional regulator/catechol 2,3-dioxygenase-like lactoylglutathione lyase family enzyme